LFFKHSVRVKVDKYCNLRDLLNANGRCGNNESELLGKSYVKVSFLYWLLGIFVEIEKYRQT